MISCHLIGRIFDSSNKSKNIINFLFEVGFTQPKHLTLSNLSYLNKAKPNPFSFNLNRSNITNPYVSYPNLSEPNLT